MRILFDALVVRSLASGVERAIQRLLVALGEAGLEEYRVVQPPRSDLVVPPGSRFAARTAPRYTALRIGRLLWEQLALSRLAAREGCTLIHAPAYLAPLIGRTTVVLTVYDLIALRYPRLCRWENALNYRLFLPLSVRRADGIVVPSRCTERDLLAAFPELRERVVVIPLGVGDEFRRERTPEDLAHARAHYRLPPRFFLFVGRREPKKNLGALVAAIAELKRSAGFPHRLVIAGPSGWGDKALLRRLRRLGMHEEVLFLGTVPQDHLPVLYALADAFVFPSLYEGFGLPPLEAMACGTPVVCSNRGALPEIVGEAALTVDPTDVAGLAAAMKRVVEDPATRARLKEAGRQQAKRFDWRRTAEQVETFYRQTALRPSRGQGRGSCVAASRGRAQP